MIKTRLLTIGPSSIDVADTERSDKSELTGPMERASKMRPTSRTQRCRVTQIRGSGGSGGSGGRSDPPPDPGCGDPSPGCRGAAGDPLPVPRSFEGDFDPGASPLPGDARSVPRMDRIPNATSWG